MKLNGAPSNRNNEVSTRFEPYRKFDAVMKKPPPVTESQQALIAHLRKCLGDAGVNTDFIVVPENSKVASHVIEALLRLGRSHGIDTGRKEPIGRA